MRFMVIVKATQDSGIGIRQIFEAEGFGDQFTPELRRQAEQIYDQVSGKR